MFLMRLFKLIFKHCYDPRGSWQRPNYCLFHERNNTLYTILSADVDPRIVTTLSLTLRPPSSSVVSFFSSSLPPCTSAAHSVGAYTTCYIALHKNSLIVEMRRMHSVQILAFDVTNQKISQNPYVPIDGAKEIFYISDKISTRPCTVFLRYY